MTCYEATNFSWCLRNHLYYPELTSCNFSVCFQIFLPRLIATSAALALPGIVDVITAEDVPGENNYQGEIFYAQNEVCDLCNRFIQMFAGNAKMMMGHGSMFTSQHLQGTSDSPSNSLLNETLLRFYVKAISLSQEGLNHQVVEAVQNIGLKEPTLFQDNWITGCDMGVGRSVAEDSHRPGPQILPPAYVSP